MIERERNPALDLIRAAKQEFEGDNRPATVEMVAQVYGPIAALLDSVISLASLARQADSSLGPKDEWDSLQVSIRVAVKEISASILELAHSRDKQD